MMMPTLSLSELKRLTPRFANEVKRAEVERYWNSRPAEERARAHHDILREFYLTQGRDIDLPMEKTTRRSTFEEENRESEEWHRAFNQFHASR